MKRAFRYLVVVFWVVAFLSWAHDAVRLLVAAATGNELVLDRGDAMVLGLAAAAMAVLMAWSARQAWRRARPRRKPVGTVELVLRVDMTPFQQQMRALQRSTRKLAAVGRSMIDAETRAILARTYTPEGVDAWMKANADLAPIERRAKARAVDPWTEHPDGPEAGVAATPAIVTVLALAATVLALIARSWVDVALFAPLAAFAAAWTYLDTATEGRRR